MDEIIEKFPQVKEVMLKFYKERVLDNLLALSPLTSSLTVEDRQKLIDKFQLKEADPGEVIVKEGDPGDSMYLIKSGKVEVTTLDPKDRRRLTLARLSTGEFFGEVSLIKNKPRTATITALNPTELLHLDRARFDELSKNHPDSLIRWHISSLPLLKVAKSRATLSICRRAIGSQCFRFDIHRQKNIRERDP
jgi:CRP-like cAMP-binding protein